MRLRKLTVQERRKAVALETAADSASFNALGTEEQFIDLSDAMVEHALGYLALPFGVATGFLIDGVERIVPMATEEPSVIAAASFMAEIAARAGGFTTEASDPVMIAQVYLESCGGDAVPALRASIDAIAAEVAPVLRRMSERGGGLRAVEVSRLPDTGLVRVHFLVDVRDAMGANLLNTVAEAAVPLLERLSGGRKLMAILSNDAARRTATARVSIPVGALTRRGAADTSYPGSDIARRMAAASALAFEDPYRAVTHNKGIMNGVSALAAATGNDTRGLEAAVHAYAARDGRYRGLTSYSIARHGGEEFLEAAVTIPVPLGTVGGAIGFHPANTLALQILGNPDAATLGRVAAAVGLAQNLAALGALVGEGILRGHMGLHARRVAFLAGARGADVARVARSLADESDFSLSRARAILEERQQP